MSLRRPPFGAILLVLAAAAVPVLGPAGGHVRAAAFLAPPDVGPVTDPPVPAAEPGDRTVEAGPSAAEVAEEHRTATPREQQQLLAGVQRLVACAREREAEVPDARVDPHGAIIPWPAGQPAPDAAVAVAACLPSAAAED